MLALALLVCEWESATSRSTWRNPRERDYRYLSALTAGVANRPHIKTHKSPMLAKLQIAAGANGITCQKLGEAEVMAEAGIDDILISYNLIGDEKMARLGALQAKANMTVAVDNSVVVAGLPQAARTSGLVSGQATMISLTPATCAGTAHISTLDG